MFAASNKGFEKFTYRAHIDLTHMKDGIQYHCRFTIIFTSTNLMAMDSRDIIGLQNKDRK